MRDRTKATFIEPMLLLRRETLALKSNKHRDQRDASDRHVDMAMADGPVGVIAGAASLGSR